MFARIVEVNAKAGKGKELARTLSGKATDVLRDQPGFIDLITLQADDNQDHVIGISFWKSKEDATKYHSQGFPKIIDFIRNAMEGTPQVRTFDLVSSTTHNIVVRAA